MITGAHVVCYSADPATDRAFLREVLRFPAVDAGEGWLIFALPPAEIALHPGDPTNDQPAAGAPLSAEAYLMCDDLAATMAMLAERGVRCPEATELSWGIRTTIPLPSGGSLGLYQPRHPTALGLRP